MESSPGELPRSPARTRAPKQSAGLFLCFALPFSNLSLYKKRNSHKSDCFFLAQMESSPVELPRSPARTRAPKQSTGLFLCFALPFSNLSLYKKETATKVTVSFWRRWRDSNSRGGCPPYALSRGASSPA